MLVQFSTAVLPGRCGHGTSQVKDMLHVPSGCSFAHKHLKMMTHASQFYKDNWKTLNLHIPFQNKRRNALFGDRIGYILQYPNIAFSKITALRLSPQAQEETHPILQLGCESTVTVDGNIEKWLNDMEGYTYHLPQDLKVLSPRLLILDETIDEICVICKQEGEIYCHRKAH
eukprot:3848901-Ditylum_brightwellii.AAC.1